MIASAPDVFGTTEVPAHHEDLGPHVTSLRKAHQRVLRRMANAHLTRPSTG